MILINEIKGYYVAEWSRGDRYAVRVMTVTCFRQYVPDLPCTIGKVGQILSFKTKLSFHFK